MKTPHLLRIGANPRKIKENLVNILDAAAISAIETEICTNAAQLYALGLSHYRFAVRQNNRSWRQKISRLYYAAYNASRAIRLCESGDYFTDVSDHKKVENLPVGFPNINRYANRLSILRDDRNLCDYDHTGRLVDLMMSVHEANELVQEFLKDARDYLVQRGVQL